MDNKRYNITLILAYFLGVFGGHRFYNKKYLTAVLMFFTLGGLGIWVIIDVITILLQKFKDSQGNLIGYDGGFFAQIGNTIVFIFFIIGLIRSLLFIF